jgi:hypothetical protein
LRDKKSDWEKHFTNLRDEKPDKEKDFSNLQKTTIRENG